MVMDWSQVLFLFFANASLILWFRAEARNDWRHMDNQVLAIHEEIKDFHGRLCAIEERNRGK
jgi:hypothetical protein